MMLISDFTLEEETGNVCSIMMVLRVVCMGVRPVRGGESGDMLV